MKRSTEANRRYWLLLHAMADKMKPNGQSFSADVWHTWAKSKFLGCDDVRLPNGAVLAIPKSSADLDVAEFSTFMTALEAFANERGVWLEDIAA